MGGKSFLLLFLFSLAPHQLGISDASSTSSVHCHASERDALMGFKQGLRDPSGRLSSWIGGDCCRWEGVGCSNISDHVIQLDLRNWERVDAFGDCSDESYWVLDEYGCRSALFGGINSSLISLRHIRRLDLSGNFFQQNPVPEFLGSLEMLTYLNLSGAGFKGRVPDQLGNLSNLHHLDLSFNVANDDDYAISQSLYIENAGWISRLTSLRRLNMDWVSFKNASDWLQAINALPRIQKLRLANCEIVSFYPQNLLHRINLTSLAILDLSHNNINSSIPHWLFNITSLEQLHLGGNDFYWPDPAYISKSTSLEALDLSANKFQNTSFLPASLSKLCKLQSLFLSGVPIEEELTNLEEVFSKSCLALRLEELDLSSTQLSGSLPDWLKSMKRIRYLDLSSNSLYGTLPASLGSLSSLEYLEASHNYLNGTIEKGLFRYMTGLIHLGLSGNSLSFSEMELAHLSADLKFLDISFNTLVLNESPESWIPSFQLKYLYMSFCKILPHNSHFPKWLPTQRILLGLHLRGIGIKDAFPTWLPTTLEDLLLADNNITGHVPGYLSKLRTLDLSNNSLSGHLPSTIDSTMPIVTLLDLSKNNLSGRMPFAVCRIKHLVILQVSRNNFFGELPDCWENSKNIIILDLSSNKFQGGIPNSLCNLRQLKSLHLSHNNFSGEIPICFKDCTKLVRLDLGHNNLSGDIPSWIEENLPDLHILILRSNALAGNIPPHLSKLEYLQVLDLSNNNLSGVIPSSFGDFSGLRGNPTNYDSNSMIHFDEMSIFIKGSEFQFADILRYVKSLDLSNNDLSGYIPKELGSLNLLLSLNLSYNHLTGKIPSSIEEMQQLEVLDLSRNNLSGSIPLNLASLNFLSHLNLSYNNLSGRVPAGSQLQTFDKSSYVGNLNLCGFPLSKNCSDDAMRSDEVEKEDTNSAVEIIWVFASITLGFITGFWMVCGVLVYKRRWRSAYFRAIDNVHDKLRIGCIHMK